MKSRPWTEVELAILKNQFATMSNKDMAEKLGRSVQAVCVKASQMGLKKESYGIVWTGQMLDTLTARFSTEFNCDLAKRLGVSQRSLIRKARELGLEKEEGFLDNNRDRIQKRAIVALRKARASGANTGHLFQPGVHYNPAGEFKPGHVESAETKAKRSASLKKTISDERIRLKYGLPQKTKRKLKVKYDLTKYLK